MRSQPEIIDSHTARATSWLMASVIVAMLAFVSYAVLSTLGSRTAPDPDCPPESTAAECIDGG